MIEISIPQLGVAYESNCVPRIGEKLNLKIDDVKGSYFIKDIIHTVFENSKYGITQYVQLTVEDC